MTTPLTVSQLATALGGTVRGDGARLIRACATLENAGPDNLSFVSNPKYANLLETTRAACVIVAPGATARLTRTEPLTVIEAQDPYFAWREALIQLHGHRPHSAVSISPLASVHPTAQLGNNVNVHPYTTIAENVTVGDNTHIYPHVALMAGAKIGRDCILYPNVTIYDACILGDRCIIHAGTVIGSDGYGFATHAGSHHKIPQHGNVIVENDVEIGANTVIERAVLDSTVIGTGTKLGNSVVIGHNCIIGPHNLLVSQVGIAGSTTTGKYVVLAGQVGVAGHLHIADMTRIAAQSGVAQDITEPGHEHGGYPAMEAKHARRVYLQLTQLPELAKRVKELESELRKLKPTS